MNDPMDAQERMFNRRPAEGEPSAAARPAPGREDLWSEEALFWRELTGREPTSADLEQLARTRSGRLAELRKLLRKHLREYVAEARRPANINAIELVRTSYDEEELLAALDVLLEDRLTMGARVAAFEQAWSEYLPSAFSVMVNSGSSANLLALAALSFPGVEGHLRPGDEVIVPAVAWSTSLFPVVQVGCVPVIVDVDLETLNMDPAQVEAAISPKTRAILAVHVLGNPCDMKRLQAIAAKHRLWVVEDCCESHGASIDGKKVGTFGDLSAFSFYFSHHMTSIEGGVVCGSDAKRWQDLLVSLRAHGWVRGRTDYDEWVRRCPDIDPRWLFVVPGYNLRPQEINAAFALVQLSRLPGFVEQRCATRRRLLQALKPYEKYFHFQRELPGHVHTAFGLSFVLREDVPFTRQEFQAYLESCAIQTRPVIGSNLARQPVMKHIPHRQAGDLRQADHVHTHGVMIANHHNVTHSQQDYLAECIGRFVREHAS